MYNSIILKSTLYFLIFLCNELKLQNYKYFYSLIIELLLYISELKQNICKLYANDLYKNLKGL